MDKVETTLSRRNLVLALAAGTGLVGIAAMLPLGTSTGPGAVRRLASGNRWTRGFLSLGTAEMAEWSAQLGSVFEVAGGWSLRLAGVRPLTSLGARPAGLRRRAFAAVFDVVGGSAMPGDLIYSARHRDYGAFDLFLSEWGEAGTRRMIAVFN